MPLPAAKKQVFSFAARRAEQKPPAFATDATLSVAKVETTNRGGRVKINGVKKNVPSEKKSAVRLDFPQADAVRATRPFAYEATFTSEDGKTVVKRVLAANVFSPDGDYWSAKGEFLTVCLDQLPPAPFRIEVCAISSLDVKSAPLTATFRK